MATVRLSKKFTLQTSDFLRGLGMAIATPVLVAIERLIDAGKVDFSWKALLMMGIGGGVSYILKNLLVEPAKTIIVSNTNAKAESVTTEVKKAL